MKDIDVEQKGQDIEQKGQCEEYCGRERMGTCIIPIIFLNFLFYIGVELINNVVIVSGVQQSDSVIHIHVSILFQILFAIRLLQNIKQSSLCYFYTHLFY